MRPSYFIALSLALLLALLPCPAQAVELDPAQELEAAEVFQSVLSPFCPGRLLRDCPSGAAQELKDKIRAMIVEGKPRAEIESYLFALYGDTIRSVPPRHGFGNVAWWGPAVFVLIGLGILGVWLRSKRTTEEPPAQELTPEMKARLDRHV
jgi:cytochrome c-type biogenesis protein CcmH